MQAMLSQSTWSATIGNKSKQALTEKHMVCASIHPSIHLRIHPSMSFIHAADKQTDGRMDRRTDYVHWTDRQTDRQTWYASTSHLCLITSTGRPAHDNMSYICLPHPQACLCSVQYEDSKIHVQSHVSCRLQCLIRVTCLSEQHTIRDVRRNATAEAPARLLADLRSSSAFLWPGVEALEIHTYRRFTLTAYFAPSPRLCLCRCSAHSEISAGVVGSGV